MNEVYVLFVGPDHRLLSLHYTIDGATHAAVVEGAVAMPDGSAITLPAVRAALQHHASIIFQGTPPSGNYAVLVERHGLLV